MQTITGQVQYIDQPRPAAEGKKQGPGSIKLADGQRIKVWARDLGMFVQGKTYEIECETDEWNGQTQYTAKRAKQTGGFQSNGKAPGQPAPAYTRAATPKDESLQIWCCGLLKSFIEAGMVPSEADLFSKLQWAMNAYSALRNPQHSRPEEPNDDIPY